jgi:hypothetical protein
MRRDYRAFVDALERLGYATESLLANAGVRQSDLADPIRVLFDRPLNAFSVGFGVVLTVLHLRKEVDGLVQCLSVNFAHAPDDVAEIERLLGKFPLRVDCTGPGARQAWVAP